MLRVVTSGVGCRPCPTPYPVRCRPSAQSHGPGSEAYFTYGHTLEKGLNESLILFPLAMQMRFRC
jgi:hypothetical protein